MTPWVVDASVVAAAFFEEEHADAAGVVLSSGRELLAPDLVYAETANVIWKRQRRGEVTEDQAGQLLADLLRLPLVTTPSVVLAASALRLALQTGRSVYDCLYIALAVRNKTVMVTADKRLVSALGGSPLERHVLSVEKCL